VLSSHLCWILERDTPCLYSISPYTYPHIMSTAIQNRAGVPIPPSYEHQPQPHAASKDIQLPPTPPETVIGDDNKSTTSASSEPDFALPPPSTVPTKVLDADKPTPDAHVARDPRLIRLTGVHPFNVEAPLSDLYNEGFLTSPELFYVRNHGPVPEVQDSECLDWEFSVEGYNDTSIAYQSSG
jgi:nitrate reductase (NAD(P)H)